MEHIYQPGDPCLECQQIGATNRLRTFSISLEDQIVKCESNSCMFPYTDEDQTSSDQDTDGKETEFLTELRDFGGEQFFEEFLSTTAISSESAHSSNLFEMQAPEVKTHFNNNFNKSTQESLQKIDIQSIKTVKVELKCKEERKPKKERKFKEEPQVEFRPQPSKEDTANDGRQTIKEDTANDDIPKARISRYFAAIEAQKPKEIKHNARKRNKQPRPWTALHHTIMIKKERPEEESAKAYSSPVSELLKIINQRT